MKKTKTIPAGYLFTFVTMYDDGYFPRTITMEGLSEEKANFIAEIANIIEANQTGLENKPYPHTEIFEQAYNVLWPVFEKHSNLFNAQEMQNFKSDIQEMIKYINKNILDHFGPGENGIFMCAFSDYYKIEYVPEQIILHDVTSKFKPK
jgi:hypothetical protein